MSTEQKLVRVFVRGGVVQEVETPAGVTVQIVDYDVGDHEVKQLDRDDAGDPCVIATWPPVTP
jgi:hypothetical protein